jgi:hypothetical protein
VGAAEGRIKAGGTRDGVTAASQPVSLGEILGEAMVSIALTSVSVRRLLLTHPHADDSSFWQNDQVLP